MFCFGCWALARAFRAFELRASWPANAAIYCTAATLALEMAFRAGFGATAASKWLVGLAAVPLLALEMAARAAWRSKWLLGPAPVPP